VSYKNPKLVAILGVLSVVAGVLFSWIGISVLLADTHNMFAKVIMSAWGKKSMITTIIGVFFTAVGIYFVAQGIIIWIALLTHSPRLERIVFRKSIRQA